MTIVVILIKMGLQDGNREQVTAAGQSNHGNDYEANKIATGTKLHIHIGGGEGSKYNFDTDKIISLHQIVQGFDISF